MFRLLPKNLFLFVIFPFTLQAQKDYTMREAVLGLSTTLASDNLEQLGFEPVSNRIISIAKKENNQFILTNDPFLNKYDTLISLDQFNSIFEKDEDKVKTIPKITWINDQIFYYQIKNKLYKAVRNNGRFGSDILTYKIIDDQAQNITIDEAGRNVAYTVDNNLFIIDNEGESINISDDNNKNIVYGQSVHRNEFGINGGIFFSPKQNFLAFYRMDESMVADYPVIDWSTTPAISSNIKYPMAGDTSHQVTLGVYNIQTKETIYIKTGEPKDQYLTCVTWDPSEQYIYIALLNRGQDHLKLNKYNAKTGELVQTLFEEKDEKYVEPQHALYFLPDGKEFVWWSQRSGYMHLYRYNTAGKLLNTITSGNYVVENINGINPQTKELIITATKESPLDQNVYRVNYTNGKMSRIDKSPGIHTPIVSKDGTQVLDVYKNKNTPRKIDLIDLKKGSIKNILTSKNPLEGYNNATIQDVTLKADDGTDLYGKLMLPHNFDATKKYPVIVYLYNGPHLQLINNNFPESGNLWHDLMTQKGFVVFSMDGRGSANRGVAFEQAVFRLLGTVEMNDQMKGVDYLKQLPFIDQNRMGVYGWSFGGFMTTSLMTRYPEVFKVGVAGGPVIDWSMYEVMYTERYMDDPQQNPEGFKNSNLKTRAKDLKGKLLMIHGAQDDVVVWQHSMQFIRECVKNKIPIDYFVYPAHPHNVRGEDRIHLMQKITDYFVDNL